MRAEQQDKRKQLQEQEIMPMMPYEVEIFLEKSQKLMDLCFLHKKYKETEQRKSVKKKNKEKGNKDKGNKGTRTGVQRKRTKEENVTENNFEFLLQYSLEEMRSLYFIQPFSFANNLLNIILVYAKRPKQDLTEATFQLSQAMIIHHVKIIRQTIAEDIIPLYIIMYLTDRFFFLYFLFPPWTVYAMMFH